MISKKMMIAIATLVLFVGSIVSSQEYQVVKVWPEAPQGWHFFNLNGVAVDKSGNVYIGDSGNYKIKKFDSEGRLITQWGSPGQGDGQFINKICSVKVDESGIVYVCDMDFDKSQYNRIQKFTTYGQFVGTLKRKTSDADKIRYPVDLAPDDNGNVFVLAVDYRPEQNRTYDVRIEKYSRDGDFISQWGTTAGSGDGQLQKPNAIAVDTEDNIYIAEMGNHRVQKFNSSGKFITKWGTSWTGLGECDGVFRGGARSLAIDETGNIYTLDWDSVQKFTTEGKFLDRWKTGVHQACRLAVDSHSNVYVTDSYSQVVTKLDSNGNAISQWGCAGTGDGRFGEPISIAVAPSGRVVVADYWSCRVQTFASDGRFVSKLISEADSCIWDLATDKLGNLYAIGGDANEVQKFDPDGKLICRWGSSGSGDGQFRFPLAIAVAPSGNVYVADTDNNRVQKFTNDGKLLAKWGTKGAGDGQFDAPSFIAVDSSSNVWVGDRLDNGAHRMQKFDANGGFLSKWTRSTMRSRSINEGGVAADSDGNSYYAFENRIEKYDADGNLIASYGQEGSTKDKLEKVWHMCTDQAGCLYIMGPADPRVLFRAASGSISKFDADGKFITKWTAENIDGRKRFPNGPITVDQAGNIYASYWGTSSILKLSSAGKLVAEFQVAASPESNLSVLGGVAVDRSGRIYAVDSIDVAWRSGIPSIKQFDQNGQIVRTWDVRKITKGKIMYPVRIAVDGAYTMYITDQSSHCVHKLDAQGDYIKSWGGKGTGDGQFDTPEGIAVDASGHVYVCDRQNSRIQKFDSNGNFLTKWGKEGSGDGEFHFPAAVTVDNEGNVFVADSDNHRVQKFTADGKFLTKWGQFGEGPGQFNVPLGIAVDEAGNVYVSDSHNQRIQKFAPAHSR